MLNENLTLTGQVGIEVRDPQGNVNEKREIKNLVVNAGLAYIASRMAGSTKAVMSHMALGSGTTAAQPSQTDLSSILGARESIDSTSIAGAQNEKVQYRCTFEAGDATGAVTEAGIFNAATNGDMLCRTTFAVVNKDADDTMTVTWTITLAAS